MSTAPDPRLKQKLPPVGIAAGAEDAKYQAKYKELKRKVKDIEADNDKLHFKVLQSKLSIRRMKMERAVLYERLTTIPPSPNLQDRHPLPPMAIMQGGPPHPASHFRPPPGGGPPHRDYPYQPSANMDIEQQRIGGGPATHIHPDNIRHHQHHYYPSHSRGSDPRINLATGIDPRSMPVDNQPAVSSPRLPVHSTPTRIPSTHDGTIARQPHHTIPPSSAPYDSRSGSNIPLDHVHGSSPVSSHHNAPAGISHSHKRSHSHSSPRTTHPHQIEVHQAGGHIHAPQTYRVLSSGSNPGRGPVPGPPGGPLGLQPLHQYHENLPPVQPLHSPPPSEMEFERGGRAHHSHPHLHQQLPLPHSHSSERGHQYPHSQHAHHHHVVHHHHQHSHPNPAQGQAHTQIEYGGSLPVGDPPTSSSASPAIQAHGAGYDSAGGRGTTTAGPPGSASVGSGATSASASGSGRTHAHRTYEYPPTTHPEKRERERDRDRDRDGARERERDRDPDREWERERDRAREYSRGELINYSPSNHRTRSSHSQSQSRPLSRSQSQSHVASGGRSQSQTAVSHNPNTSGEYEHLASNPSRSRTAPSSGGPAPLPGIHAPQAQYHHSNLEDPTRAQGYRDYPPPDSNSKYAPRRGPSPRVATPGSGSTIGHPGVAGHDNSGPRDRDRDREAAQRDRGTHQQLPPAVPAVGTIDDDASDHNHHQAHGALDSGRKRSRNEMDMDVDEEYQANEEGAGRGRRNGATGGGRENLPQDDSRGGKRYHRQADSSPERERR